MIPGPITVDDEVLHEIGKPVQAHYGAEFTAIYNETVQMLKQVFQTQADVHILVGSGSAGVDAAIGSLTLPGEKIIVGCNGFFGQRLITICESYGLDVIPVEAKYGSPLRATGFEQAIHAHPDAVALVVCHMESSAAVLNPLEDIMAVAHQHQLVTIVDAVSTLGGVSLAMDDWNIDICVGASQKCLGAPPGLAPVAVSERAWEVMSAKPQRPHGWYLNLEVWQQFAQDWADWHPFPITMATNNIMALREGVRGLLADGVAQRIQHYQALADHFRDGVKSLGLELFAADALSPVLTAVESPMPSSDFVHYLYETRGIKISGGVGAELKDRIFRVGHMGNAVSKQDLTDILEALTDFIRHT